MEKYEFEKTLVTGAAGFIGRRIVARLLDKGIPVRALALPGEGIPEFWGGRVETMRGDVTDPVSIQRAVEGTGAVIHCAALVSDWGPLETYWRITVEGSRNVYDAALAARSRVILLSSIAVYADRIPREVCTEDTPHGSPLGPYSRTKQAQENLAREYARERGLPLAVIRPANVYGAGSGPWVNDVLGVIQSGLPSLVGSRSNNAGLLHADNLADLILAVLEKGIDDGRIYNACDDLEITWRRYFSDLAAMIGAGPQRSLPLPLARASALACEAAGRLFRFRNRPPVTREALNLIGSDNRFPADRARRELGFQPRVGYEEGLEEIRLSLRESSDIMKSHGGEIQ